MVRPDAVSGEVAILLERRGLAACFPRLILGVIQCARRVVWTIVKPRTTGVRGICLDQDARLILVRHSYMDGWFLPGGAPRVGETAALTLLRELREELGMSTHGHVTRLFEVEQHANGKRDRQTVFLVEKVTIKPRLSFEIEAIATVAPTDPPDELHPSTLYKLDRWRHPERDWSLIVVPEER